MLLNEYILIKCFFTLSLLHLQYYVYCLNTSYCYCARKHISVIMRYLCHLRDNLGEDLIANSLILLKRLPLCSFRIDLLWVSSDNF